MNKEILAIDKALKSLDLLILSAREQEIIKEIPFENLDIFPEGGQNVFKNIYLSSRNAGVSIEKSLKVAESLTLRSFKNNKIEVLKKIQKQFAELVRIKNGKGTPGQVTK